MLDFIYLTLKLLLNFCMKTFRFCHIYTRRYYGRHYIALPKSVNDYSCMGIRYAKLFEAAKSMLKSGDSRAV